MVRVTKDDLAERADSVYRLVLMAARRARAIQSEATALGAGGQRKPTVRALEEIARGTVSYQPWKEEGDKDAET